MNTNYKNPDALLAASVGASVTGDEPLFDELMDKREHCMLKLVAGNVVNRFDPVASFGERGAIFERPPNQPADRIKVVVGTTHKIQQHGIAANFACHDF